MFSVNSRRLQLTHCGSSVDPDEIRIVEHELIHYYGGDEGDRTPDLGIANAALSHLSYIPTRSCLLIKLIQNGQSKSITNHNKTNFGGKIQAPRSAGGR
jgi:hypothetical protein